MAHTKEIGRVRGTGGAASKVRTTRHTTGNRIGPSRARQVLRRHAHQRRRHAHARCLPASRVAPRAAAWLGTLNVGTDCLAFLKNEVTPHILGLQELHVSKEAQKGVQAQVAQAGYKILFGAPTPWTRVGRRQRLHIQRVPGTGILYHESIQVYPVQPNTQEGQGLQHAGTLQLCVIEPEGDSSQRFVLANFYAPSGREEKGEKETAMRAVTLELATHNPHRTILVGDFNEHPQESIIASELLPRRWLAPEMSRKGGWRHTYRCGPRSTCIDAIFMGGDIAGGRVLRSKLDGCPTLPLTRLCECPFLLLWPLVGLWYHSLFDFLRLRVGDYLRMTYSGGVWLMRFSRRCVVVRKAGRSGNRS